MKKIAYVGIDYHQNSVSMAVVLEGQKEVHETVRLVNEDKNIKKFLKRYSQEYEIRACYEASSCGYVFQRKMKGWGYHCDVIAPSLIPKKAGNRRKNDFRDAIDLAINHAGERLSIVHPPTEEEEGCPKPGALPDGLQGPCETLEIANQLSFACAWSEVWPGW